MKTKRASVLDGLHDRVNAAEKTMTPLMSLDIPADAARELAEELASLLVYPEGRTADEVFKDLQTGEFILFGRPVQLF